MIMMMVMMVINAIKQYTNHRTNSDVLRPRICDWEWVMFAHLLGWTDC
jgi:hypothetical protein